MQTLENTSLLIGMVPKSRLERFFFKFISGGEPELSPSGGMRFPSI